MIELHRVSKIFAVGPVKVPALSDVSFRVAKGEFVTLCGPSGAGKTTLLRLLYRDDVPTEGEVEVLGEELAQLTRAARSPRCAARSASSSRTPSCCRGARSTRTSPSCCACSARRVARSPARVFDALRAVGLSARAPGLSRSALAGRGPAGRAGPRDRPQAARCSSPTSRPATSTRAWPPRSSTSSRTSGRAERPCCSRRTRLRWPRALQHRTLSLQGGRLVKDEG